MEQVDEKDGMELSGWVQRSAASSPHEYRVTVMGSSVGSVTHNEKFTFPSPSVSNRAQASSVLLPVTLISSQFQVTTKESGRPALSMHNCVRSFCPGSSLAPAVSLTQTSAACTAENANSATPTARSDATTITSINLERDLLESPADRLERSSNDENIEKLLLN